MCAVGRALLIGGAGFIGAHLARELVSRSTAVAVLDADRDYRPGGDAAAAATRAWRRRSLLADVDVRRGDAADPLLLAGLLRELRPDVVVHLANLPLAAVAARDPDLARTAIVDVTATVARAVVADTGRPRLVYVSSSMVYGDFVHDPQPEDAILRPLEPYGRAKLLAEQLVRAAPVPWTIVRPSAVYGPGDAGGRVLQRLVDAARSGTPFTLRADPRTRLDFTWVEDLAVGIADAAASTAAVGETLNLTAGRSRSLAEAIAAIRDLGHDLEVRTAPGGRRVPRRGTLDIGRARALLGFAPTHALEDGLYRYLRHAELVA
ncbi:hypothetical protein C7Y72_21575 [Paraconexibacter algicola]|uniref:NAD-dependent epimerase/dehydratase domain-containing protein n=1 Tax=Paraconexibacter algicola TaxID=2133960 RepID=A0A2T4UBT4_9ACTN|nr:hypothetical protein C7Y72_21575 [Paraconexibacter algicola]